MVVGRTVPRHPEQAAARGHHSRSHSRLRPTARGRVDPALAISTTHPTQKISDLPSHSGEGRTSRFQRLKPSHENSVSPPRPREHRCGFRRRLRPAAADHSFRVVGSGVLLPGFGSFPHMASRTPAFRTHDPLVARAWGHRTAIQDRGHRHGHRLDHLVSHTAGCSVERDRVADRGRRANVSSFPPDGGRTSRGRQN